MDYKELTDEQLEETRIEILIEQERRSNLSRIPEAIQELADKYEEDGGDRDELVKAVSESKKPPPEEDTIEVFD